MRGLMAIDKKKVKEMYDEAKSLGDKSTMAIIENVAKHRNINLND